MSRKPVQQGGSILRLPWVTLGLVLACLMAWFTMPAQEQTARDAGVEAYLSLNLDQYETSAYAQYLNRTAPLSEPERRTRKQALATALATDDRHWLAVQLAPERDFQRYLYEHRHLYLTQEEQRRWLAARDEVSQPLKRMPEVMFGFTPASPWSFGLVTHALVNDGGRVLALQLVVLLLLGMVLERALGSVRFLLAAMLTTGVSALGYALFTAMPYAPITGAAGLLAGCLGLYLGYSDARRWRYRLLLWVVLPLWLLSEVWRWGGAGFLSAELAISVFGVGAGLLVLMGLRRSPPLSSGTAEPREVVRFRADYDQLLKTLAKADFSAAGGWLKTLTARYPDRPELLEQGYQLAKLRPDEPVYQHWSARLMAHYLKQGYTQSLLDVWREYQRLAPRHLPLPLEWHHRVLVACVQELRLTEADRVFDVMRAAPAAEDFLSDACELLCRAHQRARQSVSASRVRYYRRLRLELSEPPSALTG